MLQQRKAAQLAAAGPLAAASPPGGAGPGGPAEQLAAWWGGLTEWVKPLRLEGPAAATSSAASRPATPNAGAPDNGAAKQRGGDADRGAPTAADQEGGASPLDVAAAASPFAQVSGVGEPPHGSRAQREGGKFKPPGRVSTVRSRAGCGAGGGAAAAALLAARRFFGGAGVGRAGRRGVWRVRRGGGAHGPWALPGVEPNAFKESKL